MLDLAHNKLGSLPSDMEMMKSLTRLNLTNNFLSEVLFCSFALLSKTLRTVTIDSKIYRESNTFTRITGVQ